MLKENREADVYDEKIEQAVESLQKQGYENIKADLENYELPAKLIRQEDNTEFVPDITATLNNRKGYFEIAKKTEDQRELVSKWRLLSVLANMKNGSFQIFVPHGHMRFTEQILAQNNITAKLVKM